MKGGVKSCRFLEKAEASLQKELTFAIVTVRANVNNMWALML